MDTNPRAVDLNLGVICANVIRNAGKGIGIVFVGFGVRLPNLMGFTPGLWRPPYGTLISWTSQHPAESGDPEMLA